MKKCSQCGNDYPEDVTTCPLDGKPLPSASDATKAKKGASAERLAKDSLVLGALSFIPFFSTPFLALAAILCGHRALRKDPGMFRYRGRAYWGLALGYGCLVFCAFFVWSAFDAASRMADEIRCSSNLKQVGLAARIWSGDHNDTFPKTFLEMTNELQNPEVLICPRDSKRRSHLSTNIWNPANITYEYVLPGQPEDKIADKVVFRCPIHHLVVLGDGSVPGPEYKPSVPK